jgi:APA family basic amino acid/polyamine antiporter
MWRVTLPATSLTPRATLPKIMIGGTAFVALIYLLLNVVYLSALPISE